jgi:hypothetical protein
MQKIYLLFSLILSAMLIWSASSCHKEGSSVTAVSIHNGSKSHNNGSNCMTCHKSKGQGAGAGWYVAAGSVFMLDKVSYNPNATVYLYTGQNATGNLVAKIEADALGNFYTTEPLSFGNGVYPVVESATGTFQYMNQVTRTGACNGCHGVSQDRIWVN